MIRTIVVLACSIYLAGSYPIWAATQRHSEPEDVAKVRLRSALAAAADLPKVSDELDAVEEANGALHELDKNERLKLYSTIYSKISSSLDIVPTATPSDSDAGEHTIQMDRSVTTEADRDDLFRRFIAIVSKTDADAARKYMKDYSAQNKEQSPLYSWEAANDLLDQDVSTSMTFASSAAQIGGFPDEGRIYLQRLSAISQEEADRLALVVINRVPGLSSNDCLEMMGYLFPSNRVPELDGNSLFDLPSSRVVPPQRRQAAPISMIQRYSAALARPNRATASTRLFVIRLLRHWIQQTYPSLLPTIDEEDSELARNVPPEQSSYISREVTRWIDSNDQLQSSIEHATEVSQVSDNPKYTNRAILLRAMASARSGNYLDALNIVSSLPGDSRTAAIDAVLLFGANTVKSPDEARRLIAIARSDTSSDFVNSYVLLTMIRQECKGLRQEMIQVQPLLSELDQRARQIDVAKQRFAILLGAANVWVNVDRIHALQQLISLLGDVDDLKGTSGNPTVVLVLPISGTFIQFTFSAGADNLYGLVTRLSKVDFESTWAVVSTAPVDAIRVRAQVAACAAVLGRS